MWDTVNMQTQKVSKVPPFDGTSKISIFYLFFFTQRSTKKIDELMKIEGAYSI